MPGKKKSEKKERRSTEDLIGMLEDMREDIVYHIGEPGEKLVSKLVEALGKGETLTDEPEEDDFV